MFFRKKKKQKADRMQTVLAETDEKICFGFALLQKWLKDRNVFCYNDD